MFFRQCCRYLNRGLTENFRWDQISKSDPTWTWKICLLKILAQLVAKNFLQYFASVINVFWNVCQIKKRTIDFLQGPKHHEEMISYLQNLPAKVFECFLVGRKIWINASRTGVIVAPVIDGDFLPKPIDELRSEAPIKNCMTGTCKYESLLFGEFAFILRIDI